MTGWTNTSTKGWLNRAIGTKPPVAQSAMALKRHGAKLLCSECKTLQGIKGSGQTTHCLVLACGHTREQSWTLEN
jgi:hypothetical protein